jgi:4-phosphopantoate--beta-alanine ligase
MIREKLVEGMEKGLVALEGLMAHGRGEAFDYLIGEETRDFASKAIGAAVARFLLAEKPVISVNGNVVALVPEGLVKLAELLGAKLEANIFYRTEERVEKIVKVLEEAGAREVLGVNPDARIEGLEGPRGLCAKEGIFCADMVFVPLEDGDRTEALKRSGKYVITVDLNPMSRTSVSADITIVDNVVRAVPAMISKARKLKDSDDKELNKTVAKFDNQKNLSESMKFMSKRLGELAKKG